MWKDKTSILFKCFLRKTFYIDYQTSTEIKITNEVCDVLKRKKERIEASNLDIEIKLFILSLLS